jgi:hypothetical protein
MLECFNHLAGNGAADNAQAAELAPSTNPEAPSLYRVDLAPVLVSSMDSAGQGISRAFESFSLSTELQENGSLECTESIIGVYAKSCIANEVLRETYQPSATDAGGLKIFNSTTDISTLALIPGAGAGDPATDDTAAAKPTYSENNTGAAFTSVGVASDRIGVGVRDFDHPGVANNVRARVQANKQYRIAWTVSSTTNANTNPQIRMRARALRFSWAQKFELGGALAGGGSNRAIAKQALPGNPDVGGLGNTVTYNMMMHTPESDDIRVSQPNIEALPNYGSASSSRKDIRTGFDIVDTLSQAAAAEAGNFKIQLIEIYEGDLVSD